MENLISRLLHVPTHKNGWMNLESVKALAMVSICGRGGCGN